MLTSYNLVDPSKVRPYYSQRGLSLEVLNKCNSQEFRYIGGHGSGYYLLHSTQSVAAASVAFSLGSVGVDLPVITRTQLDRLDAINYLWLLETAEPKYYLKKYIVSRNYNVIHRRTLIPAGTFDVLSPDATPLNLEGILDDLISDTSYTLVYDSIDISLYDVFIEGMTVFDAFDHLCSIYGLLWTVDDDTVYVWSVNEDDSSHQADGLGNIDDTQLNDIRITLTDPPYNSILSTFKKFDFCLHNPSEYHTEDWSDTSQGRALHHYDPYYYAIVDTYGVLQNGSALSARATTLRGIYQYLGLLEGNYIVKHVVDSPALYPATYTKRIHADYGSGPRSIFSYTPYPYYKPPLPFRSDRKARNWVGTLTDGYVEIVSTFDVNPSFGIDGAMPTGVQTVTNLYGWDYGQPGWKVRVEWDCENHRWIPIQQEYDCP